MSYQAIARKWRPQAFDEVTGQEHITQTLRNALTHDRLHHAYLFSGARGVGKTTTARLLAKALNCHKTDKPNVTPCAGDDPTACPSCVEIAESRSMDVLEIDAASHTGIENVREAIRIVRPYAVDVCSGVEATPGTKEWDKVRTFIRHAKHAVPPCR